MSGLILPSISAESLELEAFEKRFGDEANEQHDEAPEERQVDHVSFLLNRFNDAGCDLFRLRKERVLVDIRRHRCIHEARFDGDDRDA